MTCNSKLCMITKGELFVAGPDPIDVFGDRKTQVAQSPALPNPRVIDGRVADLSSKSIGRVVGALERKDPS